VRLLIEDEPNLVIPPAHLCLPVLAVRPGRQVQAGQGVCPKGACVESPRRGPLGSPRKWKFL